jgi:SAM-dependent methyltransferase
MHSEKSQLSSFRHYARYYDLLYGGKDYLGESQFVHERLAASGVSGGRMLELGCGTGRHAIAFAELGWQVKGFDLSAEMVSCAKRRAAKLKLSVKRKVAFGVGDVRKLRCSEIYDAAVSLFHVMGYQTTNQALSDCVHTAASHLRRGGLFLFDFWFGPAVLTERPSTRVRRIADERMVVTRIAEPQLDAARNLVEIDFDIFVEDKRSKSFDRFHEHHCVRYFFLPELEQMLSLHDFEVLGHGRWLETREPDFTTWYGWIMGRRE